MTRETFLQAWHALGARRLRTSLTLLGIIIASGSLVLLVALMRGGQAALQHAAQDATESDLIEAHAAEAPAEGAPADQPAAEDSQPEQAPEPAPTQSGGDS